MPEYSVELPLWWSDWWDLGLQPELLNRLADWQEVFDLNFDSSGGWRNDAVRDAWRKEGEQLARRLREALPETVDVQINLWPLGPSGVAPTCRYSSAPEAREKVVEACDPGLKIVALGPKIS
jgi:hypothetical protein